MKIIKRNGTEVPYDCEKIRAAITAANVIHLVEFLLPDNFGNIFRINNFHLHIFINVFSCLFLSATDLFFIYLLSFLIACFLSVGYLLLLKL